MFQILVSFIAQMLRVNRKSPLLFSVLLILVLAHPASGQAPLSSKNKKAIEAYVEADNYRVHGMYKEAIDLLNNAIDRDPKFFEAYLRLAVVRKAMFDFSASIPALEKGLSLAPELRWQKVFWIELADSHLRMGNYREAEGFADQYLQNETLNKQRIEQLSLVKAKAQFSLANLRPSIVFEPRPVSDTVNSFANQYFPVLTADEEQIVYTRRLGHSDEMDEDIVVSVKDGNGRWTAPKSISPKVNTRNNEGTCTISADGRLMIFTVCVGMRGGCDLFETRKVGDEWTVPKNLGQLVNSPSWESQPSLSADGRELYFVSTRRGGLGKADIYVSYRDDSGVWSRAENLGAVINTPSDEASPFIHANSRTLFFATDGRPGFGMRDIYYSERGDSTWSAPVNLGYPLNNHEDQFAIFITPDGNKGYYTHQDIVSNDASRIYEFKVPEELKIRYKSKIVKGVVRDGSTKAPLQARVELYDLALNKNISVTSSDSVQGNYMMVLTQGSEYALYVNASGYLFKSLHFNVEDEFDPAPLLIDVDLDKAGAGAIVVLNNIFFEHDKYDLQPRSKTELEKMVRFLRDNPAIHVEISGHTDDTGSATYNQSLSQKRAQSVVDYLVGQQIASQRLRQVGYGSKKPVMPNDSEEHRQANRRIEFRILN